jgi:hypothetical protein
MTRFATFKYRDYLNFIIPQHYPTSSQNRRNIASAIGASDSLTGQ